MPEGKNAELARRTAEANYAWAKVVAEAWADGMRDGINHAADMVQAVVDELISTGPNAATINAVQDMSDRIRLQANTVEATELDPSDYGIPVPTDADIREKIRRFLNG